MEKNREIIDPLRNHREQVNAVLMKKDVGMGGERAADLRRHDRLQYQVAGGLELEVVHAGGVTVHGYFTQIWDRVGGMVGDGLAPKR